MKDLSTGTVSIKGFSFSVETTRPAVEHYGKIPDGYVPQMCTSKRTIALDEHKVEFQNNVDMSEDEFKNVNKVVAEMLTGLVSSGASMLFAMNAERAAERNHQMEMKRLEDELDAKKHQRINENLAAREAAATIRPR